MATVICMKWGKRYGPEYVNRLLAGIRRHTKTPVRFICFTDSADGLHPLVEVMPLPDIFIPDNVKETMPWPKLSVWQFPLFDLTEDVLFLDIDLIITGPLDDFFTYHPGEYCVIENWTQLGRGIGNTSVFRFPVGRYAEIYNRFKENPEQILKDYRVEQHYISALIPEQKFWPASWCVSFKHNLLPRFPMNWFKVAELPSNARIVGFTGKPDPDEAAIGQWPTTAWYKQIYKHVRPTEWINSHWHDRDL